MFTNVNHHMADDTPDTESDRRTVRNCGNVIVTDNVAPTQPATDGTVQADRATTTATAANPHGTATDVWRRAHTATTVAQEARKLNDDETPAGTLPTANAHPTHRADADINTANVPNDTPDVSPVLNVLRSCGRVLDALVAVPAHPRNVVNSMQENCHRLANIRNQVEGRQGRSDRTGPPVASARTARDWGHRLDLANQVVTERATPNV